MRHPFPSPERRAILLRAARVASELGTAACAREGAAATHWPTHLLRHRHWHVLRRWCCLATSFCIGCQLGVAL